MMTRYYNVAGHRFVSGESDMLALMDNYEPFACADGEVAFALTIESGAAPVYTEELRQEEEGQNIICGHTAAGEAVFEYHWWGDTAGWLVSSADYQKGRLITTGQYTKMAIDNSMMILFALATADKGTVLFHAAVVSHQGRGYMFLGPSGTGKSTHARLWLKHIDGTELVNDDNPVVRDGVVYGSPWSGKTPCYRNVKARLGALTLIERATRNSIERLGPVQAFATLLPACSSMKWDSTIYNHLCDTLSHIIETTAVYTLHCLPDEEAAVLCHHTLTK